MHEVIVLDSDEESNQQTDLSLTKLQVPSETSNNDNNSESKETKESPNKKRKSYDKYDSFSVRNSYFFRIGKNAVLPAILLIDEPAEFDQLRFQELLGLIKEILPIHFCFIGGLEQTAFDSARNFETATPQVYKGDNFCFTYQFRPTNGKYSFLIPSESRRLSHTNTNALTKEASPIDNTKNNTTLQEAPSEPAPAGEDNKDIPSVEDKNASKATEEIEESPQIAEQPSQKSKPEVPYYQSPSESEEEEEEEQEVVEESQTGASEPQETDSQSSNHEESEPVVEELNAKQEPGLANLFKIEQAENQLIQHHSEQYRGGAYRGFHIFKYTMIIEIALKKEIVQMADQWGAKAANKISHYFAPSTAKSAAKKAKNTPKGQKKTAKPKAKLSTKPVKGKGKAT